MRGRAQKERSNSGIYEEQFVCAINGPRCEWGSREFSDPQSEHDADEKLHDAHRYARRLHRLRDAPNYTRAVSCNARSMRALTVSAPSSATVMSIGGETAPPVTATRNGCATLPSPTPYRSATASMSW